MLLGTVFDILGSANTSTMFNDVIEFERTGIGWALNIVRVAGTVAALIVLTVMAIKYMISDKPDSRRQFKESFPHYILGVIIFIAASNILYYVAELATYALSQVQ